VLCFHNRTNTRWLQSLDVPVAEGDTLTILQAVSGG
jgi:molybdopterin converting factor small subunit